MAMAGRFRYCDSVSFMVYSSRYSAHRNTTVGFDSSMRRLPSLPPLIIRDHCFEHYNRGSFLVELQISILW
jgi:hypothetical protein